MYYKTKYNKKGEVRFEVLERYKDPITGKWRTASTSYTKDTSRARKQAERELKDKIDDILSKSEGAYDSKAIKTFGELKSDWLETWSPTVKEETVQREKLVLKRLSVIMGEDYLLDKITPLFLKNVLEEYIETHDPSEATFQHIRSCLNKIFNHGVLYGIIESSPITSVKVGVSLKKKKEVNENRERKFLETNELFAFFDTLSRRRNPNYYDLAIFLLLSGLRIGEASALTEEDIDFQNGLVDVNKSLQSNNLTVAEFYDDDTKTLNSERKVLLPKEAIEALKRVIDRGKRFDEYAKKNPHKSFKKSSSIFRTEYGSPITSHSFREVLYRVEDELVKTSKEKYGFEWTKRVVPHSFRHMHITYLQSGDLDVALREIMGRVGHVNTQTTMIYTHRTMTAQEKSISALDEFVESSGLNFKSLKVLPSKYSRKLNTVFEERYDQKKARFSLVDFKNSVGLSDNYGHRYISSNVMPKVKKDLSEYYEGLQIKTIKDNKKEVLGYEFTWN